MAQPSKGPTNSQVQIQQFRSMAESGNFPPEIIRRLHDLSDDVEARDCMINARGWARLFPAKRAK
jgi:hypothetical protein